MSFNNASQEIEFLRAVYKMQSLFETGQVFGSLSNYFRVNLAVFCRFLSMYFFSKPEVKMKVKIEAKI